MVRSLILKGKVRLLLLDVDPDLSISEDSWILSRLPLAGVTHLLSMTAV